MIIGFPQISPLEVIRVGGGRGTTKKPMASKKTDKGRPPSPSKRTDKGRRSDKR
jgi:hypothetical protein